MQADFQLASLHGMLYTGGNVCFSPDGRQLYSAANSYLSAVNLYQEGHISLPCSNSSILCLDISPDGELAIIIGSRSIGFFYSISSRVILDTISFPPNCTITCVKFSPCGKFVALGLEATLQIYSCPPKRVVSYQACHRIENLHSVLSMNIESIEWSSDSEHLLISGRDARMKIVPRKTKVQHKGMAVQHNALVGHRAAVLGSWFTTPDNSKVISVSADNIVIIWQRTATTRKEILQLIATSHLKSRLEGEAEINSDDETQILPSFLEKQRMEALKTEGVRVSTADDSYLPEILRYAYEIEKKHMLSHKGNVSVTNFHRERGLVAIGYTSGSFAIHMLMENGELNLVHLLSISAQSLTAATFSPSGDIVAFGSASLKQLLVWDWKSESYVIKDQAHYYDINRTAITADSSSIISGGDDGKVKVWKTFSGQCYVTFTDHTGGVTGIATSSSTNAFFTCSLDGTARGYDLVRYRCFRVYTPPTESQLSCIAVDPSGEVLAVGSHLNSKIFLFSVQTGGVIDELQGHEGPIACVAFHPSGSTLASGSIDRQLILWDLFSPGDGGNRLKGDAEVMDIGSEVLSISYSNSGKRMAILTANQEITIFESTVPTDPTLIKTFSTRFDAAGGWNRNVGPNSSNYNAHFTRIAFSPDGGKIIAGGNSKWIVLYHALQGYVLKKWPVTNNLDMLGMEEQYNWKNATEAGFLDNIDIDEDDLYLTKRKILEMPGSRNRHFATGKRKTELTARTMDLVFAPTGSEFVAATTDGLLMFSSRVVRPIFQPLQLTSDVTASKVKKYIQEDQLVLALIGALTLGDRLLGVECLKKISKKAIPVAVSSIPSNLFQLLIGWITMELESSTSLQHALLWAQSLLLHSKEPLGSYAQDDSRLLAPFKQLQRALQQHSALVELSRENFFSLRYLIDSSRLTESILKSSTEQSIS